MPLLPFGSRLLCALLFFGLVLQKERLQFVYLLSLLLEFLRLLLGLPVVVREVEVQLVLEQGVYPVNDSLYLLLGAVEVVGVLEIVSGTRGECFLPPRTAVIGNPHQTTDGKQHLVEVIFIMIDRLWVVRLKQAVDILGVFLLAHTGLEVRIAVAVSECLYGLAELFAEVFGCGKYDLFRQPVAVVGKGGNSLQDRLFLHGVVCVVHRILIYKHKQAAFWAALFSEVNNYVEIDRIKMRVSIYRSNCKRFSLYPPSVLKIGRL